jgi:ATP-dependent exoDNAse (exonuclease V) beta subunit
MPSRTTPAAPGRSGGAGSVLTPDAELSFPEFVLLKASAGSGKTHALSRRFADFLLAPGASGEGPRGLPNILAITFTRTAAREMKERILAWLKEGFSGEGRMADELLRDYGVSKAELARRAEAAVEKILAGYTDFQVETIDGFTAMIFRSSAVDLGYAPDFEIALEHGDLIEYAFARFLRRVKETTAEGSTFREILDYLILQRGEKSRYAWDPTPGILERLNKLQVRLAAQPQVLVLDDFGQARTDLIRKITATASVLKKEVDLSGLDLNARGHYGKKIIPAIEGRRFADLLDCSFKTFPVKAGKAAKGAAVEAVERIQTQWSSLERHVRDYARLYARDFFLPYLRAYLSLQSTLDAVKRRQGILFIDDINQELSGYIDKGIVPDVYFRLGDRIYHYLIDEFQDTSPIQWRNLEPLIEESLGKGGSLFLVGDTKQAIYGFRDADYRIMRLLEAERSHFGSVETSVRELTTNYRSDQAILDFVKDLFLGLKRTAGGNDDEEGAEKYGRLAALSGLDDFDQSVLPERQERGLVSYVLFEQDLTAAAKEEEAEVETDDDEDAAPAAVEDSPEKAELQNLVTGLRRRGWRASDIAVLTYKNADVVRVASWLNERNIPFIPFSSLDIRGRKIIGEILSFLRFLDAPPDDLAFAEVLLGGMFAALPTEEAGALGPDADVLDIAARRRFLHECRRDKDLPLYTALRRRRPALWDRYFEPFFKSVGYLPLYDLVTRIYRVFDVFRLFPREEAALTKLLEAIKGFEGEGRNDLREFLRFTGKEEDADANWAIDVPREIDAVRIMSIHKAKGADFPVVICLLYGEKLHAEDFHLFTDEEGVHVYKVNKTLAAADPDLARIYDERRDREWVDKLNALYVALTRAKHELHIIGLKKKSEKFPFDLLGRVFDPEGQTPVNVVGAARFEFTRGVAGVPEEAKGGIEALPRPVEHRGGPVEPPMNTRETLNLARIRRGEWIHRLLAEIEFVREGWAADGAAALERLRPSGADVPVAGEAVEMLVRVFENSPGAVWFEPREGRKVFREFDVCDGSGNVYRMDRVVVDPEEVLVVDYKTGAEQNPERRSKFEDEDRAQVSRYVALMKEIYPDRLARGVLAYLDERRFEVVE